MTDFLLCDILPSLSRSLRKRLRLLYACPRCRSSVYPVLCDLYTHFTRLQELCQVFELRAGAVQYNPSKSGILGASSPTTHIFSDYYLVTAVLYLPRERSGVPEAKSRLMTRGA
jgi:hypothetical protein